MSRLARSPRILLGLLPLALGCQQHLASKARRLPIDGIRFVGHATLTHADSLEVRVRAVNTSRAIRTLEFSDCALNVGVASVAPGPTRKWEYVTWASARRPRMRCLDYQGLRDLAPGDSVSPSDYRRRLAVHTILGDSLPPGRYRITARVAANGQFSNVVVGEVELVPASSATATDGADDRDSNTRP